MAVVVARTVVTALVAGAVPLMHLQYCCTLDTLSGVSRYRWVVQAPGSNVVQAVLLLTLGGSQHLEWHRAVSSASENLRKRGQAVWLPAEMESGPAGAAGRQGVHRSLLRPLAE